MRRFAALGWMLGVCGVLAGCNDAPRHAPDDPFYVGKRPGAPSQAHDPSVGTGQSPMGAPPGGGGQGAGPYMSGGAGGM